MKNQKIKLSQLDNRTKAIFGSGWIVLSIFMLIIIVGKLSGSIRKSVEVTTEIVHSAKEQLPENFSLYRSAILELKRRESLRLNMYLCPAGYETIGYGTRWYEPMKKTITEKRATILMKGEFEKIFSKSQKALPKHSRNEQYAVAMIAYNLGFSNFLKTPLFLSIKNNQSEKIKNKWIKYCNYKNPKTGKYVSSDNLKQSRLFEMNMYFGHYETLSRIDKQNQKLVMALIKKNI